MYTSSPQKARRRTLSRPELADEQKQEIKEAFEMFDTNQDGAIDYHQLQVAMRACGIGIRTEEGRGAQDPERSRQVWAWCYYL